MGPLDAGMGSRPGQVPGAAAGPRGRRDLGPFLLVLAAATVAYLPTLRYGLVWDDIGLVRYVAETVRTGGLSGLLRADYRLDSGEVPSIGYYRPIVLLSLWLDGQAARILPSAYHLTNILLHAVNSVLVFLLVRTGFPGSPKGALVGALLFAVHPVHVEAVAFVGARADLWAPGFALLATILWLRERLGLARFPRWAMLGSLLSLFLACLSKELALVLPLVLLFWSGFDSDAAAVSREAGRHRAWLFGWAMVVGLVLFLRWTAGIGFGLSVLEPEGFVPPDRVLPLRALLLDLRLLVIPWPLNAYYEPSQVGWSLFSAAGAAALIAVCAACSRSAHRRAGLLAAVWILVFLLPVLGVVPRAGAPVAERFLYLPSVGLAFLFTVFDRSERPRRPWAWSVTAVVLAVLAAATVARGRVWRDESTLFSDLIRTSPGSAVGYDNLGRVYADQGRFAEALEAAQRAVVANPRLATGHGRLGLALGQLGRHEEAEAAFRRAIRLAPRSASAYNALGVLYAWMGRQAEAVDAYRQAIRIRPWFPDAYANLGIAYHELGRHGEAAAALAEGLRQDPASVAAHRGLGMLRLDEGRDAEALALLVRAVELSPGNAEARLALGVACARLGRRAEAEQQRRALAALDRGLAERLRGVLAESALE